MSSHALPSSALLAPSLSTAQAAPQALPDTHAHLYQLQRILFEVQKVALKMADLRVGQIDETSRLDSLEDKLQAIVRSTVTAASDKSLGSARSGDSLEANVAARISKLASQVSALSTVVSRLHAQHSRRRTLQQRYEHI